VIAPRSYELVANPFGSHVYHSHHDATEQVGKGMLGPLLIMVKNPSVDPRYDKHEVIIFNDQLGGFTLNGKGFPATKAHTANVSPGERWDVVVRCDTPGAWAFHCHILGHAEAATGTFGMVTALIVA